MRLLTRRRMTFRRAVLLCILGTICYSTVYMHSYYSNRREKSESFEDPLYLTNVTDRRLPIAQAIEQVIQPDVHASVRIVKSGGPSVRGIEGVDEYCNSPFVHGNKGEEGTFTNGFKLKMVHVFIRHGDRTSMNHLSGYKSETYNCKFDTWYTGSNEKFKLFPQRMDRMSNTNRRRNYFQTWSLYPNNDKCANSDLTSRGALQHLRLGQHLYYSYNKHVHLFDRNRTVASQIKVKSTGTFRTYQSAVAFLYAFLPVFNMSDTRIEHSPNQQFCTPKFAKHRTCYCQHAGDLKERSIVFQSTFNKHKSWHTKLLENISQIFHIDQDDTPFLSSMADVFVPTHCHNFAMPCSIFNSSKCLDKDLLGKLWDGVTVNELLKHEDPGLNMLKYSSIIMSPVLLEIENRMKHVINEMSTNKFVLYSGHDITLSPLLYVFGLHDGRWPPYASRLVIELYEFDRAQSLNRFYLKFLFNGVDKTREVNFCRGKLFHGLCNIRLFREFILVRVLSRYGYSNYKDACS